MITPFTLLAKLVSYRRFRALPERVPGQPGPGLDPGKPLFRRWQAFGFLLPLAALALVVTAVATDPGAFREPDDVPVESTQY